MNLKKFIKDKLYFIILYLITYFIILLMFLAFQIDKSLIIASSLILFVFFLLSLIIDYLRKRTFYTNLLGNIENLDKAFLVLETIDKPEFYEGELLYQALYEINKSMNENIKNFEEQISYFKEYIEMWIHEVKIPISSLILMAHNHKDKFDRNSLEQIRKIECYVDQVLYYVRSENAEKDYLIKKTPLKKIISSIALKNKDDLLENKIDLKVENINHEVYTDSKWLEFIINQIVNNSIKYKKDKGVSYIKISSIEKRDRIFLTIEDNGIGIPNEDLSKVFNKSFTGHNGRIRAKSTGMGLFIAKNLCKKLGHTISIESHEKEYTKVTITFAKNEYYEVIN